MYVSMYNYDELGIVKHTYQFLTVDVYHRFGIGSGPVAVGEIICEGSESHLLRCQYKQGTGLGMIQECQSHAQDVGIVCGEYMYKPD